jgi:ABC-type multidrug transport system fused ATPase/permease subunit
LRGDRTVILVTHRLNSVAACDRIYTMDHGRITDAGTYSELLSRKRLDIRPSLEKDASAAS